MSLELEKAEAGEPMDIDDETAGANTQEAVAQEPVAVKLKQNQRPLKDRLLWKESKIQIGDGAYRSMEATLRVPTMLGFVVDIIERNRKMLAAAGMAASLAVAGEQAKTLYEMHPFESTSPVAKQRPDPAKEILVPYTEIGGLNVPILAENCQGPLAPDCKINLGSGSRKFVGDEPVLPFPLERTVSKDVFLKTEDQSLPGNVGKYHYDPKKAAK